MHFLLCKYLAFKCISTLLQLKAAKKKKGFGWGGWFGKKMGKHDLLCVWNLDWGIVTDRLSGLLSS